MLFRRKQDPLTIPQHLPIGRPAFDEWANRIITYAELTADKESQLFALADSLTHLPPGKAMETDGYFVFLLRKYAVNETAVAVRKEIYEAGKAKLEADKAKQEQLKAVEDAANATLTRIEETKLTVVTE